MLLSEVETDCLRDEVRQIMRSEGIVLDELAKSASDIIVFGSRAVGVHRKNSDVDLLIISDRSGHIKRGKLDLVYVPRAKFDSPLWRRTELARHIDAYGISLIDGSTRVHAIVDEYAAQRKQARLNKLIKSLLLCWNELNGNLRVKYFMRVGRELQRYRYLKEGSPVPPTAILDSNMLSSNGITRVLEDMQSSAGLSRADAASMQTIMMKEARRIAKRGKRPKSDALNEVVSGVT